MTAVAKKTTVAFYSFTCKKAQKSRHQKSLYGYACDLVLI
jgi:hypothetical protein